MRHHTENQIHARNLDPSNRCARDFPRLQAMKAGDRVS